MKKLYTALFAAGFLFSTTSVDAQCTGDRYRQKIFSSVNTTSNVLYGNNVQWTGGSNTDLYLDVYEPAGDTETSRPVVILIHGGSFVGGSKTGGDVVPLAQDFAKMGYVAVSIQYRLGMNTLPPDSVSATEAVIRGYHDCKAAIRYLRWDEDQNGNTFGIDPGQVFLCGVSAGGFVATHIAYLDEVSEMPSYVDYNKPGLGGGLEGESGNLGYADTVSGIINICGALRDTAWMYIGDTPILSLHAVNDGTVPYGQDVVAPFFGIPILVVNGSDPIHDRADEVGIVNCFKTYQNVGNNDHTPHVFDNAQYDTTLVYARNFLVHMVCGDPLDCSYSNPFTGIAGLSDDLPAVNVFPNPANEIMNVDLSAWPQGNPINVTLMDLSGKMVREFNATSSNRLEIHQEDLANGMYMLRITDGVYNVTQKVLFE